MPQQVPGQAARQMRATLKSVQRQMADRGEQARLLDQMARGAGQSPASQAKQLEALRKQLQDQPAAQKLLEQAQQSLAQGNKESAQKAIQEARQQLLQGQPMEEQQELSQALQQELSQLDPQQGIGQDAPSEGEVASQGMPGNQPGQGKKPGKGDFGTGSTNEAGKSGTQARQKARNQRQSDEERHKSEQFKQLYEADRKYLKTRREHVALHGAKGKLLRMSDSQLGAPRADDPSLRPEQADFLEAKALAEQSVAEERIPVEHRQAVRRYFDQIDPRH